MTLASPSCPQQSWIHHTYCRWSPAVHFVLSRQNMMFFKKSNLGNFQAVWWLQSMLPLQIPSLGGELRSQGPHGAAKKENWFFKKKKKKEYVQVDSQTQNCFLSLWIATCSVFPLHCIEATMFVLKLIADPSRFNSDALLCFRKRHGLQLDTPCEQLTKPTEHWNTKIKSKKFAVLHLGF